MNPDSKIMFMAGESGKTTMLTEEEVNKRIMQRHPDWTPDEPMEDQ